MAADPAMAGSSANDLQPSDGVFSEPVSLSYHLALRDALLAEHADRRCQMLTVPSFEPEWVVYLVRDGSGPAQVVVKKFKTQLWLQMPQTRPNSAQGRTSKGMGASVPPVEHGMAVISPATADLLELAWDTMLARVKYPENVDLGLDGTTYYISHWKPGVGVRSGQTWSPDSQSVAGALVAIAIDLRQYALAKDDRRAEVEARMSRDIRALFQRLESLR